MADALFGSSCGPGSGAQAPPKAGAVALFGNHPTSPSPSPAAPAAHLPQPRAQPRPQPVSSPPQPWQLPRRPVISPQWNNPMKYSNSVAYPTNHQTLSPAASYIDGRDADPGFSTKHMNLHISRTQSPVNQNSLRMSDFTDPNARPDSSPDLVTHQRSPSNNSIQPFTSDASRAFARDGGASSMPVCAKFQGPKRIRSPPMPSASTPVGVSLSAEMNTEREMQAKAKRLARFHTELSQPAEGPSDFSRKTPSGSENNQMQPKKVKFPAGDSTKKAGDIFDGGPLSDYEGLGSYPAICGLCPDMCPETEREERQRKGDLDRYERLDGERNQTSISLAVKKYNRTAERDAELIRPLPVLQMTVDYLLDLLNQPYDDHFLRLYNFLWDRMRAIRMDLRMQHIFNRDSIHMLEQMIRLHIIAMHELSENKKGEGFSEGFDAHLNIEQMNKTSVELFQMYDDHRKKGSNIPTEREFRGYYALLKLDKHPGYKVEPAELSLDLAKMTPEIRCSSEILFARDVARACRTSNFIAFFRLARKAAYLQACLMHAHFSKLRSQALASLHSGLQSNQGVPVSQVVKWLAMEGEDIESLLEYHGFSTKRFEEPYMVKEGPFLNSDVAYPTKCSQLVKLKISKRIVDDVCHGQMLLSPDKEQKILLDVTDTFDKRDVENHAVESCVDAAGHMLDYEMDYASTTFMQPQVITEASLPACWESGAEDEMGDAHANEVFDVAVNESLYCHPLPSDDQLHFEPDRDGLPNEIVSSNVNEQLMLVETPGRSKVLATEISLDKQAVTSYADDGQLMRMHEENNAAAQARLKLILRIWKRRSSKKKEMREQRQSLADAALSSLPLGPPVRQNETPGHARGDLNIDVVVRERCVRNEKSWSRLNVSEVVSPILSRRNPLASCVFWKVALCLQTNDSGSRAYQLVSSWLLRKLMGTGRDNDNEHVIHSSNLSVWKKQLHSQVEVGFPESVCYSVVREVVFSNNLPVAPDGTMVGISAVIFLVSGGIPWAIQKVQLEKVLTSVPSGSSLPLLILSDDACRSAPNSHSIIVNSLGLQYLDKMIVSDYSIVSIGGNDPPQHANRFFSDNHLEGGLRWLAENSPLQPCLHRIKIRDLALSFLNPSLTGLKNVKFSKVGPDHCITIFNEALDRSIEAIRFTAAINKNCWPGPEVELLKDLPYDSCVMNMLPSRDWSCAARIEPLIGAIGSCKLPSFPDDLSWLDRGFDGGSDISSQKLALEQCLFSYLTNTVGLVGGNLAAKEANVMIQKGTGLELRGKHHYIVPRWVEIFRRIYHWRLSSLSSGKFTSAYVLERGIPGLAEPWPSADMRRHSMSDLDLTDLKDNLASQGFHQLNSALTQLSLDELIESACSIPPVLQYKSVNRPGQAAECSFVDVVLNASAGGHKDHDRRCSDIYECKEPSLSAEHKKESIHADGRQMVDKLKALLEKCNRQQNVNDEKLAIYF